jgi:hypothetical protein
MLRAGFFFAVSPMNIAGAATKSDQPETLPTPHSSYVSYFRYDPKTLRLEVGLKHGSVVEHSPVYPQTWLDLKIAPSKGRFYIQTIKRMIAAMPIRG